MGAIIIDIEGHTSEPTNKYKHGALTDGQEYKLEGWRIEKRRVVLLSNSLQSALKCNRVIDFDWQIYRLYGLTNAHKKAVLNTARICLTSAWTLIRGIRRDVYKWSHTCKSKMPRISQLKGSKTIERTHTNKYRFEIVHSQCGQINEFKYAAIMNSIMLIPTVR